MSVKDIIDKRRAYRNIEPFKVTDEFLKDLAGSASLSPSCFNNQPWRFVFVHKEQDRMDFRPVLSSGNEWAYNAGLYVVVFSKPDLDCRIKEREYFLFDTGMAVAFMMLRATELGYVMHPIAGYSPEKAKKLLNIPDEMTVITVAVVGKKVPGISDVLNEKQKESETARPDRHPLEKMFFYGKYSY